MKKFGIGRLILALAIIIGIIPALVLVVTAGATIMVVFGEVVIWLLVVYILYRIFRPRKKVVIQKRIKK